MSDWKNSSCNLIRLRIKHELRMSYAFHWSNACNLSWFCSVMISEFESDDDIRRLWVFDEFKCCHIIIILNRNWQLKSEQKVECSVSQIKHAFLIKMNNWSYVQWRLAACWIIASAFKYQSEDVLLSLMLLLLAVHLNDLSVSFWSVASEFSESSESQLKMSAKKLVLKAERLSFRFRMRILSVSLFVWDRMSCLTSSSNCFERERMTADANSAYEGSELLRASSENAEFELLKMNSENTDSELSEVNSEITESDCESDDDCLIVETDSERTS